RADRRLSRLPAPRCRGRLSALTDLRPELDDLELDVAHQPFRLAQVDQPRLQAARRLRAARDAEAKALVRRAALVARREVPREERVARAAACDGLARRDACALEPRLAVHAHQAETSVGERHDRLTRA